MGSGIRVVTEELAPGDVVWIELDPTAGNEQAGTRPCVVVSSRNHLRTVPTLVSVVSVTSKDRGWDSHVPIDPEGVLPKQSWAMAEQVRTLSRERIRRGNGRVSVSCFRDILWWVRAFIADPSRV